MNRSSYHRPPLRVPSRQKQKKEINDEAEKLIFPGPLFIF
jgi:hypothetical protein